MSLRVTIKLLKDRKTTYRYRRDAMLHGGKSSIFKIIIYIISH